MAQNLDLGGNTVIAESFRVGATGPGQLGTEIAGTELTVLDSVTPGTAAASKAVVLDSNLNIAGINTAGIALIDLDSATATLVSNAATVTKYAIKVTTESLTTAGGASQVFTITKTGVATGDFVFVQRTGLGTNTTQNYTLSAACSTNTVTVTAYNNTAATALNGTLIFNLIVFKA